jgi:hypothetical protein
MKIKIPRWIESEPVDGGRPCRSEWLRQLVHGPYVPRDRDITTLEALRQVRQADSTHNLERPHRFLCASPHAENSRTANK